MSEYHKINTIFKRGLNHFVITEYSQPEFEYLKNNFWCLTEKIDGTNIRVIISHDGSVEFRGRTDKATIPVELNKRLDYLFQDKEKNRSIFPSSFSEDKKIIVYGEGYGAGIQKGGGLYSSDQDLIVFDIKFNNWWAPRGEVETICGVLSLRVVPIFLSSVSLTVAVDLVKSKPKSLIGDCFIEGLVCRPMVELQDNNGHRIITKIKCKDFQIP